MYNKDQGGRLAGRGYRPPQMHTNRRTTIQGKPVGWIGGSCMGLRSQRAVEVAAQAAQKVAQPHKHLRTDNGRGGTL